MQNRRHRRRNPFTPLLRMGLTVCAIGLMRALPAQQPAYDVPRLLHDKHCYACHSTAETLLGPSYQAIALRHAQRKEVMTGILAQKIIRGGGGNWGYVPMVPNEQVSIEEARAMAQWILGLSM